MKLKMTGYFVGIFLILLELSTSAYGFEAQNERSIHKTMQDKQVTLISIPGLSFIELKSEQLDVLPHLRRMIEQGAIGAMNIRTANRTMRDVYMSMGAGEPTVGLADLQAFEADEMWHGTLIPTLRERYIGKNVGDNSLQLNPDSLIVPDIARLLKVNAKKAYGPGMLGDLLKAYGIQRTVIASGEESHISSEDGDKVRRYSPLMLMDSNGLVDKGVLGRGVLTAAVDRPFGVTTDYAEMLALLGKREPSSVYLIEFADLYRLYADKEHYPEARFQELKTQILLEMDQWFGQWMSIMKDKESLWLFSPEVHSEAAKGKMYLAPLVHYTRMSQGGLLVSESTRRPGVVTMQDFTSTLMDECHIPLPAGLSGLPLSTSLKVNALGDLQQELSSIQMIYRSRPLLLYPFVTCEMIVLLVSLLYVMWVRSGRFPWRRTVRTLLYALLVAPAVMLILGLITVPLTKVLGIESSILLLIVLFIGGSLLLSAALEQRTLSTSMIWLAYGTAGIIMLDACIGSPAMKYAVLGYDPMIGARYYGIGNEYMGVMIGALVLGVTAALQRRGRPVLRGFGPIAAFLLVTVCLAAPSLGANAGGALSAAVAFGVAGVQCFAGGRWRELRLGRGAALLTALLALGFGALWLLNSADSPAAAARESHVGRAFHALRAGQFDQIGYLIERKLRMNAHLLRASAWSKVLITSLFVMAVLVLRPRGRLRVWKAENPYWMYGFSANMIGAIAALLLNDSGIVAAATMIIFVAVPMLLLRLQELETTLSTAEE
ncbi:hypothetical protein LOZ80_26205 [Paenibacillus sp. HWE-109]|uniref:hypothetical protein n=1 Tax=Paenibacillus sp. HWE-109 TaxID=1306526 RepID=UPI001EDF37BB|nr:hypothetical protein [Paenibacillus sp. HWE-109]UKS25071.1 hypothetical protein LOZ80_26205 [Paenibacillus sp. HWE-109]